MIKYVLKGSKIFFIARYDQNEITNEKLIHSLDHIMKINKTDGCIYQYLSDSAYKNSNQNKCKPFPSRLGLKLLAILHVQLDLFLKWV